MKYFSILFLVVSLNSVAQTDVLLDNFQSGIPLYYSMVDNDGLTPDASVSEYTSAWISAVDPDNAANKVASSTSYFDPVGLADRWLITPQLNLGAYGNYLSWIAKSHDASYAENYYVFASTTDNELSSFTDTIAKMASEPEYWTEHEINLSELGYDNQSIYLAVVLRTYDGFKFYVDSMHVWKNDPVGLNELSISVDFTVAPNPATDVVKVSCNEPIQSLKLIGMNGEVIVQSNNTNNLFLSNITSGVYFVEVTTDKGIGRKKVIKL